MYFRQTLFILYALLALQLNAQDYKFDHITANEGLGDNFVRRLFEDSYGYIWIGTKDGLSRYDGYDIKTFKRDDENKNGLRSSYIGDIKEDRNGNIWIGTGNGIALFEREYERFTHYYLAGSRNNKIFEIETDSIFLWMGCEDGICKFNTITKEHKWYFTQNNCGRINPIFTRVNRLKKGKDDILWIGFAYGNGLVKFNTVTEKYTQYSNTDVADKKIPSSAICGLNFISESILLIGCFDVGVLLFNCDTETWTVLDDSQALTANGLDMTWTSFKDSKSNIWVGSINGGLFLFDSSLVFKKNYIPYESNTQSLNSASISTIIEDKNGNLWFGTHGGGVNILYRRKNRFVHFQKTTLDKSLSHNFVSCFYESEPGYMWIGTDGGGLNRFNLETHNFEYFNTAAGLTSNSILSIHQYDSCSLVISTWEGGVILFNTDDYSSTSLQHDENDLNSISYKYLKDAVRKGDSLYIFTHGAGMNIYTISTQTFHHAENDSSLTYFTLPETGNKGIFDSLGNLWITTTSGLYRLKDSIITDYFPDSTRSNSINDKYVTDIFIDSQQRIWLGTLNGLNLYDPATDGFINFKSQTALNGAIMSICEDNEANLWFGTNRGLIKYNPENNLLWTYDEDDGLQGNQFFERSSYRDSRGTLYFGGMNGYNTFHPDDISIDSTVPTIVFTDFKLFYASQIPGKHNSILKKHINFTKEITLDYAQNIITIEFAALHFFAPSKNEYKYILEGFDRNWYNLGSTRQVTYTNLSPGTYTFRVKACNGDKVWTRNSKNLRIVILPPWWMTWWFIMIIILGISASVLFVIFLRTYQVKKQNRILEENVRQRTEQLMYSNTELEKHKEELLTNNEKLQVLIQTKDRLFAIIAHDLKNPLNSIMGFSELLVSRWANMDEMKKLNFAGMIHSSSNKLFSLLENLLDWSRSQTGNISVKNTNILLSQIIDDNIDLLSMQASKKDIRLTNDCHPSIEANADRNMINTVVRNLLSNAIKYSPNNGHISLYTQQTDADHVSLSIRDNGVGMEYAQKESLFKVKANTSTPGTAHETGTGLGLIVCKEFIDKNNGEILVESELGKGTEITIILPIAL